MKTYSVGLGLMIFWLAIGSSRAVDALDVEFGGQISAWTIESRAEDTWRNNSGARSLAHLTLTQPISDEVFVDTEVSVNSFFAYDSEEAEDDFDAELYRLKFRLATTQTETRLGLQKINFGPAQLLRSLRWFDRLDPRDPLQLTDGVYALRFTYAALNNANVWLWGLYGNGDPKGYEALPSVEKKPEFGGRAQYPVFDGELAATLHTRVVNAPLPGVENFREHRVALDGRWEVKVGFWFETVWQYQDTDLVPYRWAKNTTLGMDYTFDIGNGVYTIVEHFTNVLSKKTCGWEDATHVSAFSLNYSFGLFDSASAIGYYAWEQEEFSQYLSWQRTYDNLAIHVNAFHYPESSRDASLAGQQSAGRGYGGQLMVIYYF